MTGLFCKDWVGTLRLAPSSSLLTMLAGVLALAMHPVCWFIGIYLTETMPESMSTELSEQLRWITELSLGWKLLLLALLPACVEEIAFRGIYPERPGSAIHRQASDRGDCGLVWHLAHDSATDVDRHDGRHHPWIPGDSHQQHLATYRLSRDPQRLDGLAGGVQQVGSFRSTHRRRDHRHVDWYPRITTLDWLPRPIS